MGSGTPRRTDGQVPLRRLLDRETVEALLGATAAAAPGGVLALVDIDGTAFVGEVGDAAVSAATLRQALAEAAQDTVRIADGLRVHPLRVKGTTIGGLFVRDPVAAATVDVLRRCLTAMLGQATDLRVLGQETLDRYREINVLYRVGETIGASLDAAEIPSLLLSEASRAIRSDVAVVLIGPQRAVEAAIGAPADVEAVVDGSRALVDEVLGHGRPVIVAPPTAGSRVPGGVLVVPIRGRDDRFGAVVLGRGADGATFTASDEKLLLAVAGEAGVAYDRARLHEQEVGRQRLDEELAVGRRIQLSLLPASTPAVPGWEFAAVYRAAREVGGDFYDFLETREAPGAIDLIIGDVTGKGVPAALMMAFSRAVLRASVGVASSPSDVLRRANHQLIHDGRAGLFVTALYARLDLTSGDLVLASGGHDSPLWVHGHGRRTRLVHTRSSILGAFLEVDIEDRRIHLAPGDVLVLYTDGVTEARDPRRRLFGERRLRSTAAALAAGSATSIAEGLMDAVRRFAGDMPPSDDLTLVVVKRQDRTPA